MLIGIDASRTVIAQRTGTEAYALYAIQALCAAGSAHRFRLYFSRPPAPGLIPKAANCEQRVMPFPRLWTHVRLSTEMLAHPPDVLWVPSHVLPLVHPGRSVVTVHDLGHRFHPKAHTAWQRWYLEWSTRYHVRSAAHIIVDSLCTESDLVRLYGADPARITVAHLGIDPALRPVRDPEATARVQARYGIHHPYLLYLGTLHPRKNLVRLMEAFTRTVGRLGSAVGDLQLVLAGKVGWLHEPILARAQALDSQDRVVLTGFVEDVDLPALYSGARLFVMPSLYEGFCIPVLEAMACGTPVACSNVSSLPEVAGDAALLFDPLDVDDMAATLTGALADEALRADCAARGIEHARQFTWKRCAGQVLDVLEQVGR